MSSGEIIQTNNTALGDIVAGDKTTINITRSPLNRLTVLLEQYQREVAEDAQAREILEELQRYREPRENPLVPLEEKLMRGHRAEIVPFALEAKERFNKSLARSTYYLSAQKIHAHVLSKIWSVFQTRIRPVILAGAPLIEVDRLIETEIIEPILVSLEVNPFNYSEDDIHGMIYYLTGNCYIWWS